jgi:hypothetical protein
MVCADLRRMAEIRTVTTLRSKAEEIMAAIGGYERRLAQARADLAHVQAAITLFEASSEPNDIPAYVDVHRLFAHRETAQLCKKALAEGPKDTRQLAMYVMRTKGLDTADKVLAKAISYRLIHMLRRQRSYGHIVTYGKRKGAWIWGLPDAEPLPLL